MDIIDGKKRTNEPRGLMKKPWTKRLTYASLLSVQLIILLAAVFMSPVRSIASDSNDIVLRGALQLVLNYWQMISQLKGISAAIILPEGKQYLVTSGWSNRKAALAMKPELIFGIGSITKSLTAALILELEEERKLTLEDRIEDWLPPFEHVDGRITLRQLLNHTSGVYNFNEHEEFLPIILFDLNRKWTPEEILQTFLKEPNFQPGEDFAYSNTNYLLLGLVAERAAGFPVAVEYRKRFFGPLGLDSFYLAVEEEPRGELAHGWADLDGDGILDDTSGYPKTSLYSSIWTSGALFSTALDMAAWMKALFEGRVLGQASLDRMMDVNQAGYGLGIFKKDMSGRRLWGHNGGTGEYATYSAYDPESGISLAVFLNQSEDTTYNTEIYILQALLETVLIFQKKAAFFPAGT